VEEASLRLGQIINEMGKSEMLFASTDACLDEILSFHIMMLMPAD
jgi:hypothetical protein